MLNKSGFLAIALATQVVLAGGIFWHSATASVSAPEALLPFPAANIERIELGSPEASVQLEKHNDQWQLTNGLPADSGKVDALLDDLAAIEVRWPTATSTSAQTRFKVAASDYERKLSLSARDETAAEVYVGTSAGLRKSHLRRDDQSAIYTAPLDRFGLAVNADDWLDKSLIAAKQIAGLESAAFSLKAEGDQWQWSRPEALDRERVKTLVERWQSITVSGISDYQGPEDEALTYTVRQGEQTLIYHLLAHEDSYLIKRADLDTWFRLSKWQYDALTETNLASTSDSDNAEPTSAQG